MERPKLISFVIPCYYSEKIIRREVEAVMEQFAQHDGYECEFILVNDGSKDGTYDEIKAMSREYPNVKGVNLMRGFGQQNAQLAGMRYAKGDYIMGIDDDMQNHPSQVFKLIYKMEEGYDITFGTYDHYENGFFKKLSSRFNRLTSRIMLGMPKDIVASSFWIITPQVRDEAVKCTSFSPILDALFYSISRNIGQVTVEHYARAEGKSGYTFRKLVGLWLSYWNFSIVPLRASFMLGFLSSGLGILVTIILIIKKITDPAIPVGWASTLCIMILLFGAVLMVLGVVGEYLGKALLILNGTPQYIIRETDNIDDAEEIQSRYAE